MIQGISNLPSDLDGVLDWELFLVCEPGAERLAPHIGHDVEEEAVSLTRIEDREDVWMGEIRSGFDPAKESFFSKALGQAGIKDLQGNLAVVLQVLGQVDRGHAAAADLPFDLIGVGQCSIKPLYNLRVGGHLHGSGEGRLIL
jgi:hypothetical protein